jgi:hypothetical protein
MLERVPEISPPAKVTPVREAFVKTQLLTSIREIGALLEIIKLIIPVKSPLPIPLAESELEHGEPPPRHSVRFPLPLLVIPTVPDPLNVNEIGLADAGSAARLARTAIPSILRSSVFIFLFGWCSDLQQVF